MRIKLTPSVFLIVLFVSAMAVAHEPPLNARVFFIGIEDGGVVESSFEVKFGIEGFGITPAGTKSKIRHRAGHYHLLVLGDEDHEPHSPVLMSKKITIEVQ